MVTDRPTSHKQTFHFAYSGDKVALNPAISSCGKCKLCRSNAAVLCGSMKPFGFMPNSYGGLMEALVHPAECVFK